jgi:hypothetical protein
MPPGSPNDHRPRTGVLRTLWRVLRAILLALAAVILAIEEWGWRPLTAWAGRLGRWPPIGRLEARIRAAPPKVALGLFLVPAAMLFPVKLLALWFIHIGRTSLGLIVILAAKALGTALVGRLFIITEPQLTQFAWFARSLAWWRATKLRVRAAVDRSTLWQSVRRMRRWLTLWVRRRLRSAR